MCLYVLVSFSLSYLVVSLFLKPIIHAWGPCVLFLLGKQIDDEVKYLSFRPSFIYNDCWNCVSSNSGGLKQQKIIFPSNFKSLFSQSLGWKSSFLWFSQCHILSACPACTWWPLTDFFQVDVFVVIVVVATTDIQKTVTESVCLHMPRLHVPLGREDS